MVYRDARKELEYLRALITSILRDLVANGYVNYRSGEIQSYCDALELNDLADHLGVSL